MLKWSRRSLLKFVYTAVPLRAAGLIGASRLSNLFTESQVVRASAPAIPVADRFPSQPLELVREMVLVSHFSEKRVRELVESQPSLANATHDWGFGDWETPLGAASHMGNRGIAEYLISKGARPSLFSAAMLGQVDVVKAFLIAHPDAFRIRGPHSISLLGHARMGGQAARAALEYLQSFGEVEETPVALTPEETSALVGTYKFGMSPGEQVEVDADVKVYAASKMYSHTPQLNWTRKGGMPRALFHLGDHAFWPAGAPAVRIRFTQDANGTSMSVLDPDVVITARRNNA